MDPHRIAQERSLAYHRAVAAVLPSRPDLMARARARAAQWSKSGERHSPYAQAWQRLLEGPWPRLLEVLTDPGEVGCNLRQATPFAGALEPRERWRIWREVRAQLDPSSPREPR